MHSCALSQSEREHSPSSHLRPMLPPVFLLLLFPEVHLFIQHLSVSMYQALRLALGQGEMVPQLSLVGEPESQLP